ncbi:MAG TPA: lamin tail domain-containing protein, partial [bacterium]|nr:lamin tail domain-containing protein [bacterium]
MDNNVTGDWSQYSTAQIWNYSQGYSNTSNSEPTFDWVRIIWSPSDANGDTCVVGDTFKIMVRLTSGDPDPAKINSVNVKIVSSATDTDIGIIFSCYETRVDSGGYFEGYARVKSMSTDADGVIGAFTNEVCTITAVNESAVFDTILVGQAVGVYAVVFNEVSALDVFNDFIELYNTSNASVDIGGCYIQDNGGTYQIPGGTIIAPYGYLVLYTANHGLTLSHSAEDYVKFLNSDGIELITPYSWNSSYWTIGTPNSRGRFPDGNPNWKNYISYTNESVADWYPTPGTTNNPAPIIQLFQISSDTGDLNIYHTTNLIDTSFIADTLPSDTIWYAVSKSFNCTAAIYLKYGFDNSYCSGGIGFN